VRENQRKNTEERGVNFSDKSATPALAGISPESLRLPLFLLIAVVIPIVDQVTKWIIISRFSLYESLPIIEGFLSVTRIHNSGIAFGFFPGLPRLFVLITIASMLVVVYFYVTIRPRTLLVTLGCSLILGGAAGNLIDRLHYGYVVDFINFSFWPAFNVADSSVSVGVALLLANFLFEHKETKEHASNFI